MYMLIIAKTIKKMTVKDFIYENYHQQIRFTKENSYYSMEHKKKKDLQLSATKLKKIASFLPTDGFKWIEEFDLNKYTRNSSKGCALEVDLEYHKQLRNCIMTILWLQIK